MHMVATNLCVWTQNIVQETLREIRHLHQPDRGSNESSDKEISKWRKNTVAINSTHLFIANPPNPTSVIIYTTKGSFRSPVQEHLDPLQYVRCHLRCKPIVVEERICTLIYSNFILNLKEIIELP